MGKQPIYSQNYYQTRKSLIFFIFTNFYKFLQKETRWELHPRPSVEPTDALTSKPQVFREGFAGKNVLETEMALLEKTMQT